MSGIEKIPLRIPDEWSPEWFRKFIIDVLSLADSRNARGGQGIQITGTPDGFATISSEGIQALADASLVVTEPEGDLGNSRVLQGQSGSIEIIDHGPGNGIEVRLSSAIPLNRLAPIAGLSILGSPAEGDDLEIEPIESSSDHTVLRRVPDTDPESENDSTLDWGPLTLDMAPANLWTYAKIQEATALSVLGRSSNSQGNLADIVAGSDHAVLRRSGSSIGFGTAQVAGGGTGRTSVTSGALLLGSGTGAMSPLAGSTLGDLPYWNGSEFVARSIGTKRVKEVAFADPLVLDFSDADTIFVELTGDPEIQLQGAVSGQRVVVMLRQDATGSRTVGWSTNARFSDDVPEPTLSTDPGVSDKIIMHFDEDGEALYDVVAAVTGYPPPSPVPLDGLVVRLDATTLELTDQDPVVTWPDESPQGNDAEQSTAGDRPTYEDAVIADLPAVEFSGAEWMTLGELAALQIDPDTEALTVFAVVLVADADGGTYLAWRDGADVAYQAQSNADETRAAVNLRGTESTADTADAHPDVPVVLAWRVPAGGPGEIRQDGAVLVDDAAVGAASLPAGTEPVRLGAHGDGAGGAGGHLTGHIGEVIAYDRALSSSEVDEVESYLTEKWLTYSPDQLDGLYAWLAADEITGLANNDPVSLWADSSGNGRDASQSGSERPIYRTDQINGLPAVHFNGTDQWLEWSGLTLRDVAACEVHCVLRKDAQQNGSVIHVRIGGTEERERYGFNLLDASGDNEAVVFARRLDSDVIAEHRVEDAWTLDTWHVVMAAAHYQQGDLRIDVDTVNLGTSPLASSGNTSDTDPNDTPTLGASHNVTNFWPGDIAEIIVFESQLTQWQRRGLYRYLNAKYDMGLTI